MVLALRVGASTKWLMLVPSLACVLHLIPMFLGWFGEDKVGEANNVHDDDNVGNIDGTHAHQSTAACFSRCKKIPLLGLGMSLVCRMIATIVTFQPTSMAASMDSAMGITY